MRRQLAAGAGGSSAAPVLDLGSSLSLEWWAALCLCVDLVGGGRKLHQCPCACVGCCAAAVSDAIGRDHHHPRQRRGCPDRLCRDRCVAGAAGGGAGGVGAQKGRLRHRMLGLLSLLRLLGSACHPVEGASALTPSPTEPNVGALECTQMTSLLSTSCYFVLASTLFPPDLAHLFLCYLRSQTPLKARCGCKANCLLQNAHALVLHSATLDRPNQPTPALSTNQQLSEMWDLSSCTPATPCAARSRGAPGVGAKAAPTLGWASLALGWALPRGSTGPSRRRLRRVQAQGEPQVSGMGADKSVRSRGTRGPRALATCSLPAVAARFSNAAPSAAAAAARGPPAAPAVPAAPGLQDEFGVKDALERARAVAKEVCEGS